jgi:hypothetical protein
VKAGETDPDEAWNQSHTPRVRVDLGRDAQNNPIFTLTNLKNKEDPRVYRVDLTYGGGLNKQVYLTRLGTRFQLLPIQYNVGGYGNEVLTPRSRRLMVPLQADKWFDVKTNLLREPAPKDAADGQCLPCHSPGIRLTKGVVLWEQSLGSAGQDCFNAIAVFSDGFALGGRTTSQATGATIGWVARIDKNGKALWNKIFGGPKEDLVVAGALYGDGLTLVGSVTSQGKGGTDAWLVRLDSNGVVVWERAFGTPANEGARAILPLADGFLLAGVRPSAIGTDTDMWLLRTDAFGNTSCETSGVCAGKLPADCDDKNPCTADNCDGSGAGCFHTNLPNGSACGYGKSCKQGACQ